MADLSGTVLDGKYEIIGLVGEGGMGSVYEARHKLIGRRLAVKFLHAQYVTSEEVVTRFQREAQAAAAIGHENIIEVTDMGQTPEGAPFLVMEYLEGQDVRALLAQNGPVEIARTAHIMVQALSALQAAHEAGIIHRDLKPENIFLIEKSDRQDYVKLLDFGISKFRAFETEGIKGLTQTGTVLGTPYYMSPEQARGDQNIGPASDIYAMGVILFQMLTGTMPFDAPNYNALLIKILTEDPPDPLSLNPNLPIDLVQTIKIAMSRESERRFQNCLLFRDRLMSYIPGGNGASYRTKMSPASQTAVQAALATNTQTPLEMTRSGGVVMPKSQLPLIIGGITALSAAVAVAALLIFGEKNVDIEQPVVPASTTAPLSSVKAPAVEAKQSDLVKKEAEALKLDTVILKISADPTDARISIDGERKTDNPFESTVPKDDAEHKIEIQAEGYKTMTANTRFDEDKTLSYTLTELEKETKKLKKVSHKTKKEEKKETTTSIEDPTTSKKSLTKKPRRQIDDADPWRNN